MNTQFFDLKLWRIVILKYGQGHEMSKYHDAKFDIYHI